MRGLDNWECHGALLIVPPFGAVDRPSLAAHQLQACARKAGLEVHVLYASAWYAAFIGERFYQDICYAPTRLLLGERVFAAAAYGVTPLGRDQGVGLGHKSASPARARHLAELVQRAHEAQRGVESWCEQVAEWVAARDFMVVGCSSTFEQTAASVALLRRIKERRPGTVTLLGGANCDGDMARGLSTLDAPIDHIFSGESERTFPAFLEQLGRGITPSDRIVRGDPCLDLDALPRPDYSDFYQQLRQFLPNSEVARADAIRVPYETSRGCWWGEKHHCTFCGLNATTMKHRTRSPDRVIEDLQILRRECSTRKVCMVDNIMPHTYFDTLLPRLAGELPDADIFYEQKANLRLDQMVDLGKAGIDDIQPGIEALSTPLLRIMDKGVTASRNLALLRYARSTGVRLSWNLLFDFPDDGVEPYEETLRLIPLVQHLQPPTGLCPLTIDRFSPYFDRPGQYGIRSIEPLDAYGAVLPDGADVRAIAYHFLGDYSSAARDRPDLMQQLLAAVNSWMDRWSAPAGARAPSLEVTALSETEFVLNDTRGLPGCDEIQFYSRPEVETLFRRRPAAEPVAWALEKKLMAPVDGWLVPLATAEPATFARLEGAGTPPRTERHAARGTADVPVARLGRP